MPTRREREYYRMGFSDGLKAAPSGVQFDYRSTDVGPEYFLRDDVSQRRTTRPKRKLSAWNKYVKNKRNHITYRDGKLNLKKMAVAFRRKKRR